MMILTWLIPATILYVCLIVYITNYQLIPLFSSYPQFIIYSITAVLFYTIYGTYISIRASTDKCNNKKWNSSISQGIKTSIYVLIIYFLVYFIKPLRTPFYQLIGNNDFANSIAESFFITMNLIIASINVYFRSASINCQMNDTQFKEEVAKLDKYYDTQDDTPTDTNKILIKD